MQLQEKIETFQRRFLQGGLIAVREGIRQCLQSHKASHSFLPYSVIPRHPSCRIINAYYPNGYNGIFNGEKSYYRYLVRFYIGLYRFCGRRPQKIFWVLYKRIRNSKSEENGLSISEYERFFGFSALYKRIRPKKGIRFQTPPLQPNARIARIAELLHRRLRQIDM